MGRHLGLSVDKYVDISAADAAFLEAANPATILDLIQALRLSEAGRVASATGALRQLTEACELADANGDLDAEVDGLLLYEANKVLDALKDNFHD